MQCQICNKKLGEYQCSVCNKLFCEEHHKTIDGKVYCTEHLPRKQKSSKGRGLKIAIFTILILLIGILFISYIVEQTLGTFELFTDVIPIIEGFASLRTLISSTLVFILVILIIAYIITKKSKNK